MPVTFSSYRLGPGQRVSNKTVPPPWDWLLRRENELGPRRSKSRIIFAVLVPPLYVAVQAPALIVTIQLQVLPKLCLRTFSPAFVSRFSWGLTNSSRRFSVLETKLKSFTHQSLQNNAWGQPKTCLTISTLGTPFWIKTLLAGNQLL